MAHSEAESRKIRDPSTRWTRSAADPTLYYLTDAKGRLVRVRGKTIRKRKSDEKSERARLRAALKDV